MRVINPVKNCCQELQKIFAAYPLLCLFQLFFDIYLRRYIIKREELNKLNLQLRYNFTKGWKFLNYENDRIRNLEIMVF